MLPTARPVNSPGPPAHGGCPAAGAVLRRPDVFHAAVAGTAPSDLRVYDTRGKER